MSEIDFLVGQTVEEIRFGAGVRIVLDKGEAVEPAIYVDLGRYTIRDPSGDVHAQDEARPAQLGRSLAAVGTTVESASTHNAVLRLSFSDGSELRCNPSSDYEAWQAVSAGHRLVVCTTDRELAVFDLS